MPEYLPPGVFVEEVPLRAKSIEGVSTTTTGFVGPTRFGPLDIAPEIVTSLVEFERTYGGRERLEFDGQPFDNYMWHAARAFFEEGGKRLYVSRVYTSDDDADRWSGHAQGAIDTTSPSLPVYARFPGRAGNARVGFTFNVGQNLLVRVDGAPGISALLDRDVVWIRTLPASPPASPSVDGYYLALRDVPNDTWVFSSTGDDVDAAELSLSDLAPGAHEARAITVTVAIQPLDGGEETVVADLPMDPDHRRAGSPDSLFGHFAEQQASQARARNNRIVFRDEDVQGIATGVELLDILLGPGGTNPLRDALLDPASSPAQRRLSMVIDGGGDGRLPTHAAYEGDVDVQDRRTGLRQFEDLEDISIVAAPGSTLDYDGPGEASLRARAIVRSLIGHAERMRYRIAVLDCGNGQSIPAVRAMRAELDSSHAALYYPWVRILDPLTGRDLHLPPSGFVAGIYARNDANRGVHKAPANEVVHLALGFERFIDKAQQEVLNPEGINCFRFLEGRGMRLWGARTISADPEWKYVNLRRYFAYLGRSIDEGTQWAVFEPNGEPLWANVRRAIEDFLFDEWRKGALQGDRPDKAFFVKCDRSTMSQSDLDDGRMVCLVGVAPMRPAEFVIFRIGQWTADHGA